VNWGERYIRTGGRLRTNFGAIAAVCLSAFLSLAGSAQAAAVNNQRPLLFSFDGEGTTSGKFKRVGTNGALGLNTVAVDDASGSVYAIDGGNETVDKFDAFGHAQDFPAGPAAGTSSLLGPSVGQAFKTQNTFFFRILSGLAVDNSGGLGDADEGEQGRLYVSGSGGPIDVFDSQGNFLWALPVAAAEGACGMTVDAEGHLWVGTGQSGKVLAFDTTGAGPPSTTPIAEIPINSGAEHPCGIAISRDGKSLYVAHLWNLRSSPTPSLDKYSSGTYDSPLVAAPVPAVAVDQSLLAGHIFTVEDPFANVVIPYVEAEAQDRESRITEYEPCSSPGCGGTPVDLFGPGQIGDGRGIAYNPAKDWLYVSDYYSQTVKVFGPLASGAAPDVTSKETDGITKTEATVNGTINPQGAPNSYHFEWIKGEAQHLGVEATGGSFKLSMTSALGSGSIAAGSNVITGLQTASGAFHVGDAIANPSYLPTATITGIGAKTLTISVDAEVTRGDIGLIGTETTPPLSWNAPANAGEGDGSIEAGLEALPIGSGNISVTGTPASGSGAPGEYTVVFENSLAGHNILQMSADASSLTGGAHKVFIRTVTEGQSWAAAEPQPSWPEANPGIKPTDSADHQVSHQLTGLRPNTTYDVRLAGTNVEPEGDPEKRLDSYASPPGTFTTLPPPAPTVSGLSISAVTTESVHIAATVDPKADQTAWQILTSTEAKAGASQTECEALGPLAFQVAKEGTIPLGEPGAVNLEEDLTNLETSQTYCVRLRVTNGNPEPGVEDAVFATGSVKPTEVKIAFVAPRTDTSARINAYVNPEGEAPLTYRFEYSTDGATWIPLQDIVSEAEARRQIVVGEQMEGLAPDTTYHYRLGPVANEAGAASVPAGTKTFKTRTTAEMALPPNALGESEKRGIELVNSPDKNNQHVMVGGFLSGNDAPVTADGDKMVWTLSGGAPGGTSGVYNAFLAERKEGSGWHSRAILPPAGEQVGDGSLIYRAEFASPDFTHFIFRTEGGLFPGEDPKSTYVRLDDQQHQEILAHFDANAFSTIIDATADTAHVLHAAEDTKLLEDIGSGTPEVVGRMADGSPPPCGIHSSTEFAGHTGGSAYAYPGYQWISSTDASRVYFQTQGSKCGGPEGLYVRNRNTSTTTLISNDASFIRATTDGKAAYFVTAENCRRYQQSDPVKCLEDATKDKNSDLDVYRWDEETDRSNCITCVVDHANVSSLQGAVRVSDDFSHVYFLSTSQLVSGLGRPGDLNLYAVSGGALRFVADPNEESILAGPGQMEMSSDGNVLVFLASARLTADSIGSSCTNTTFKEPHRCRELYRYDDRDGSLECLSCLHGGTTNADVFTESSNGGDAFRISRDGSTIAFTTAQALLPTDVNGGYDIYEWRNGAVRLVSDGETKFPTALAAPDVAGVDASGENIFFVLTDPGLTGFEHDGVDNVYDARIGGGFPRPTAATHCSEESCQGPLQGAPDFQTPVSGSFQGAGNVPSPRRCRRGRVRRHGRCTIRHPRKHRHKRGTAK
jgi:hypothetical protein